MFFFPAYEQCSRAWALCRNLIKPIILHNHRCSVLANLSVKPASRLVVASVGPLVFRFVNFGVHGWYIIPAGMPLPTCLISLFHRFP